MTDKWTIQDPIKLSFFKREFPGIPGGRVVLFRRGVPRKVLPKSSVALKVDFSDLWTHDGAVAVADSYSFVAELDSYLFTTDRVEIVCKISALLNSKQDDESLKHIAVGSDELMAGFKEKLFTALQRKLRTLEYEVALQDVSAIEDALLGDEIFRTQSADSPYAIVSLSIIEIKSKDGRIITEKEKKLIVKSERLNHAIQAERETLDFELKKQIAEQKLSLGNISKRSDLELQKEESEMRAEITEKFALVNKKYGVAALSPKSQYNIQMAKTQALIAAASGNTQLAKEIIDVVMKSASADWSRGHLDLLRSMPQVDADGKPTDDEGEQPETPARDGEEAPASTKNVAGNGGEAESSRN